MNHLRNRSLQHALAIVLGGVFIYASIDKIVKPAEFARIIYHYRLIGPDQAIGPWPANFVAVTLPWVELVVGVSLVLGVWRRASATIVSGLLVAFIGAVSWALFHGIDIENCGCFSVDGAGRAAGIGLVLGDLAMLAAALILAFVPPREPGAALVDTAADPRTAS